MGLLEDVRARLEIVELVSGYVPLAQAGRSWKARCPFHAERTPSFYVFPDRQTWRCFGACAEGGDAISFVMKVEGLPFREALRLLAQRMGVALPAARSGERLAPLHRVNDAASHFYHRHLLETPEGKEALGYLEGRGVAPDTVRGFRLGLAPGGWEGLRSYLVGQGFQEETLLEAGLVTRPPGGQPRDLFRGRLLFPVRDPDGRVVGFGGRSLDGSEPKYLNTPRTPVFDKGALLYALDTAAEAIRRQGEGVVVEGYMDALMAHQHGHRNVVAAMGTALTPQQVAHLAGLASSYVLALDPDAAGQGATLRSLEGSWRALRSSRSARGRPGAPPGPQPREVSLRVAILPEGQDPAELVRREPARWPQVVEAAVDWLDFMFDRVPGQYDLATTEGKLALGERLAGLVLSIQDPGRQDGYLRRLEGLLGVDRRTLERALDLRRRAVLGGQAGGAGRDVVHGSAAPLVRAARDPLEEYTLALLLLDPSLEGEAGSLQPDMFQRSENREAFIAWSSCRKIELIQAEADSLVVEHLQSLLASPLPPMDRRERVEALAQCARRLEERRLREMAAQDGARLDLVSGQPEEGQVLEQVRGRLERLRDIFAASRSRKR